MFVAPAVVPDGLPPFPPPPDPPLGAGLLPPPPPPPLVTADPVIELDKPFPPGVFVVGYVPPVPTEFAPPPPAPNLA